MTMEISLAFLAVSAPVTAAIIKMKGRSRNGVVSPVEFAKVQTTLEFVLEELKVIREKLDC